ncbi:unnamed protein product, partial [Rotaria sp. Silwood2]
MASRMRIAINRNDFDAAERYQKSGQLRNYDNSHNTKTLHSVSEAK